VNLDKILDDDGITDEEIARQLTALAQRTVSVDEVCGFVDTMRSRMVRVDAPEGAIDTCGTGGDQSGTFNISTAAALLLAGGGVFVAKHGNRAATSQCGSCDVLEALGIAVDASPEAAARQLSDHDFVFLFAPRYHPALKRLATIRKRLGFPTIFNILGPLLNPADVKRQVIGTFNWANAELLAQVVARMGHEHTLVLTSEDGLDEVGLAATAHIFEIRGSDISESTLRARDFGFEISAVSALQGGDAKKNAEIITVLAEPAESLSPHQRVVVMNAGLGFYVAGKVPSIAEGVNMAKAVLASGRMRSKLRELTSVT
jgi:anthranilate phosphoribosyltransferase